MQTKPSKTSQKQWKDSQICHNYNVIKKETICACTDIVSFFNDMPVHEDGVRENARESECTEKHGSPRDGVLRCNYDIDENMI